MLGSAVGEFRDVLRGATATHRRLRDHLVTITITTVGVDLFCAIVAFLLERYSAQTEIKTFGSAAFWTTTQLLTVSSQIKNPISFGGRILDVLMEIYAITVIAGLAGAIGTFLQKRGEETKDKRGVTGDSAGPTGDVLRTPPSTVGSHANCRTRSRGAATPYRLTAMAVDVLRVADRVAGDAIERLTSAHHARRLGRLGRSVQRSPPDDGRLWAAGEPPPRSGNSLNVLIEGAAYFPALEQAIRAARRSVLIAGWCVTPGFALVRDEPPVLLRELLGEAAESVDVRVLLWAGAPVPVFAPRRASVRAARDELVRGTRIKVALDSNERPMHCHHEKLVVIDDELAFVGGIDVTDLGGDRYDTPEHPGRGRMGWHDVASRLRGPAVADVARHLAQRWQAVTGERLEAQPADVVSAGDVELQIVRTVPERLYEFAPHGDFRIIESYLRALRSARHLVYLENQFLWSPEIVNILAGKLRRPPTDEFRVVIMLPGRPNTGEDDTRGQLALLAEADGDHGRFLATTIRARSGNTSDRVYVHAKVGIVDDRWLTLGSANLNAHSFFNDTEVNIVACDAALARDTRLRLWAAHLERDIDEIAGDPSTVIDELWRPIAAEQRERRSRGAPLTHGLVELPTTSRRSERLLGPLQALLVDG